MARAHAADGEKLAPYETTLADLYLIKAREEQGHARYADAKDLAADSIKLAELAAKKSVDHRASPPSGPIPQATLPPAPLPAPVPAPVIVPAPEKQRLPASPGEQTPQPAEPKPAPTDPSPPERTPVPAGTTPPERAPAVPQPTASSKQ